MAIRKIIESDLSGKQDAATVTFGLADMLYEIDLTPEEKKELEQVLKPYVRAGRRSSIKASNKSGSRPELETTVEERVKIRAWARETGLEVTEFGRIPNKVIAAYREAMKGRTQTGKNGG